MHARTGPAPTLFALLDDEALSVITAQVELTTLPRQRVWKIGYSPSHAHVTVSGKVRVPTVDEDQQEVVDEVLPGEFFGFASVLDQTSQAAARAVLGHARGDPYLFILLLLSMWAAIQAPIIMMSQNRRDKNNCLLRELNFESGCNAPTPGIITLNFPGGVSIPGCAEDRSSG